LISDQSNNQFGTNILDIIYRNEEISEITENTVIDLVPYTRNVKFLHRGKEKYYVKGVTYGAFKPDDDGIEFHDKLKIKADFELMKTYGINSVRIPHTTPPVHLLDIAHENDLSVMVGLSAEQYIGYLIDNKKFDIKAEIRKKVLSVKGHPALLAYSLGNEIPASLARWLGPRKIENYLNDLYKMVKVEDPDTLITYVNYPTTEYLNLTFIDFISFNIYLEERTKFENYVSRLHNLYPYKPILMSEVGLDALRNGEDAQSEFLSWQLKSAFEKGCAGVYIFSWTDEWYRAGSEVDDWKFGITDIERKPKKACQSVKTVFTSEPYDSLEKYPKISVVICTYNGSETLDQTLKHIAGLEYPDYEVIVVNDGSTDTTSLILEKYRLKHGFKIVETENKGLSSARNQGIRVAKGEIIAFIDDDAYPDSNWLHYLAMSFSNSNYSAVGGPNNTPGEDSFISKCIGYSPGGPIHVMIDDELAEHIPGCNMAFRKSVFEDVGLFDERFRIAGDDVDLCWRLLEKSYKIAYNPCAIVWHHRRDGVFKYLKQQKNYGKAESILEDKWPQKYNSLGHVSWSGKIYNNYKFEILKNFTTRIYQGVWGTAPYQSIYETELSKLRSVFLLPEWIFLNLILGVFTFLGLLWKPLIYTMPLLIISIIIPLISSFSSSIHISLNENDATQWTKFKFKTVIFFLQLLQPSFRLYGRLTSGLTPWRNKLNIKPYFSLWSNKAIWFDEWELPDKRVENLENLIIKTGATVIRGSEYDNWDLKVKCGMIGGSKIRIAIEDHGAGTQYIRIKSYPVVKKIAYILTIVLGIINVMSFNDGAYFVSGISMFFLLSFVLLVLRDISFSNSVIIDAVSKLK